MGTQRRRAATPIALAATVLALAALAGCTGQASSGSASGEGGSGAAGGAASAASGPADGSADGSARGSAAARPAGGSTGGAGAVAGAADVKALAPRVIRTAQVVVEVDGQLAEAVGRVRAVARTVGGTVSSETTTYADGAAPSGKAGRAGQSLLVLRVPEPDLDRALALVTGPGGVGKELNRTTSAQDVTGDIADLESRVATQRASVARVRALLASAKSLSDVVLLESELSKRQSDLDAVDARRAALADQADLATLTVDLRTAAALPPPVAEQAPFLRGLRSGWAAVTASTTVVVTVLGALLPVAVVAALVGGPVLWVLRRRRAGARTPAPIPDVP